LSAGYRKGEMISSKTGLIYTYAIYLIGKQDYNIDSFTLRKIVAKWYFMTALTARYSSSPETKMERDLNNLRNLRTAAEFIDYLDSTIKDTLTDDFWSITLPNNLATTSARGPSLFAYYASLNLLDAQGLFSNIKISELLEAGLKANKSALERHHLYPKAYLERIGISEQRDQNQIANYALVEWSTNIAINDTSPEEYFDKYSRMFTNDEMQKMMHFHALPCGWEKMDYFEFLANRRRLIAGLIHEGFEKL
nr:hypothetical protein [Candidatus Cloacimonadota bacterium]